MSRHALVLLCAIAAPATSFSLLAPTLPVHAATACNAAPKSPPPQGSHWYYRTDRAAGRKCWYLAAKGQKLVSAASRAASVDDAPAAAQATEAPPEQLTRPAGLRLTEPSTAPAPQSDTSAPATALVPPVSPPEPEPAISESAPQQLPEPAQVLPAPEPQAQPVAAAAKIAPASSGSSISKLQFGLLVLSVACLLASAALCLAGTKRRRTPIQILDLHGTAPLRAPAPAEPRAAPRPAVAAELVRVDEERLRQFARAWRQQPA